MSFLENSISLSLYCTADLFLCVFGSERLPLQELEYVAPSRDCVYLNLIVIIIIYNNR